VFTDLGGLLQNIDNHLEDASDSRGPGLRAAMKQELIDLHEKLRTTAAMMDAENLKAATFQVKSGETLKSDPADARKMENAAN